MTLFIFALILISVLLSVAAQILLKHGMSNPSIAVALESSTLDGVMSIATNISVILGLSAYVASAGIWLVVLSKLDVSKAYPFVGLGFILTMFFAYFFLDDPLTLYKLIGTLFVFVGVIFVSLS